jgi:uncharacterized protein YhaN
MNDYMKEAIEAKGYSSILQLFDHLGSLEQQVRELHHQVYGLDAQLAAMEAKCDINRKDYETQFIQHSITISILEERDQQVADLQAKHETLIARVQDFLDRTGGSYNSFGSRARLIADLKEAQTATGRECSPGKPGSIPTT